METRLRHERGPSLAPILSLWELVTTWLWRAVREAEALPHEAPGVISICLG
jgi:hypothetical protein